MSFYQLDPPTPLVRTPLPATTTLPRLDPDLALWESIDLTIWPFTGPPTTGMWPQGWMGVDNTSTVWVCTIGGSPGTWAALGGGTATTGLQPEAFGAKGDGVYLNDAGLTAGVAQLTSRSANFNRNNIGADVVLQTPVAQVVSMNGVSSGALQPHAQTVTAVGITGGGSADVPELTVSGSTSAYHATNAVYVQNTGTELDGLYFAVASVIDSTHLTLTALRSDTVTGSAASSIIDDGSAAVTDWGKPVAGGNIPAGAFVGAIVPGVSFQLVDGSGNPLDPTGPVTSVTIGTAVSAASSGSFTNGLQLAISTIVASSLPATVTAGDTLVIHHGVYGSPAVSATGTAVATIAAANTTTTIYVLINTNARNWTITGTNLVDTGSSGGSNLWAPFVTSITGIVSPTVAELAQAPTYDGVNQPAFYAHNDQSAFAAMLTSIPANSAASYLVNLRPGAFYGIGQSGIKTLAQSNGFLFWNFNGAALVSLGATNLMQQLMPGFLQGPGKLDLQSLSTDGLRFQTGLVNQGSQASCATMVAGDATNTVTFSPSIPFAETNAHLGGTSGFGVTSPVVIGGGEQIPGAGRTKPNGTGAGLRSYVVSVTTDGSGNVTSCTLQDTAINSCSSTRIAWGDVGSVPIAISYFGLANIEFTGTPPGAQFALQTNDTSIGYPFIIQRADIDQPQGGFNFSATQEVMNFGGVQSLNFRAAWGHDDYGRALVLIYGFDHCHCEVMIETAPTSASDVFTIDQEEGGMAMVSGKVSIRDPWATGQKIINNAHFSAMTYMVDVRDQLGNYQAGNSDALNLNQSGDTGAIHVIQPGSILPHGINISGPCIVRVDHASVGPSMGSAKHWAPFRVNFAGQATIIARGSDLELTGTGANPGGGTATVVSLNNGASAIVDIQGGRVLNAGEVVTGANASLLARSNNYGGLVAIASGSPVVTGSVGGDVQGLSLMVNRSASATVLPSEYSIASASITLTMPAGPPPGSAPNVVEVGSGDTVTLASSDGSTFTTSSLAGPGRWSVTFDPTNGADGTWRVFPA